MASYALVEDLDSSRRRVLMIVHGEDNAHGIASELAVRGYRISVQEHIEHGPSWAASSPPRGSFLQAG